MQLLIAVINNPDQVMDILDEFYREEVKGATVMDSVGMAHLMAHHVPFFSRFAAFGEDPTQNKTIFVVVETENDLKRAVHAIERITGDLEKPDTGVVITLPIAYSKGWKKRKGDESVK